MQVEVLFLGSGASLGVPVVACKCAVCHSLDPHNKRLRPSVLLKCAGKQILIDSTPDFREQALKYNITMLDGVLLTHLHYDHMGGFDDLRTFAFFQKQPLPVFLSKETHKEVKKRFNYLLDPTLSKFVKSMVKGEFVLNPLNGDFGELDFVGIPLIYFSYFQGNTKVTGYRIGSFAYVTDIFTYSDEVIKRLQGVKTLVVSTLRITPTAVHFGLNEALAFADKIGPDKMFLTHIAHDLDHEEFFYKLPSDVFLAYDGLQITG